MSSPNLFQKMVLALAVIVSSTSAFAQVSKELEGLGDRKAIERASRLESRTRVGIVQGRTVPRDMRFEFGANYGPQVLGDSYVFTQNFGVGGDFHVNSHFSLGVRYMKAFNGLTAEGKRMISDAKADQASTGNSTVAQVSFQDESYMGIANWYMFYGKMNLFDIKTVQFDIYSLAGYGQVKVETEYNNQTVSDWVGTWTAGGGIAFWLTQHITSRFELRYQSYAEKSYAGNRDLNLMVVGIGLGVLL